MGVAGELDMVVSDEISVRTASNQVATKSTWKEGVAYGFSSSVEYRINSGKSLELFKI